MVGIGNFPRINSDDVPVQYHKWYWPWLCAIAINFVILWVFAANAELRIVFGRPQPPGAVPVIVLTESQIAPVASVPDAVPAETTEPEPDPAPAEEIAPEPEETVIAEDPPPTPPPVADIVVEEIIQPEPEPEPVVIEEIELPPPPEPDPVPEEDYANLTGPEIDELYRQRTSLPEIDLPEVGAGGASGVVAIFCPDVFDDPDKAAECAGRPEIRSGWMRTDEDWTGITEALRRGGVNVPGAETDTYGPAWRAPLAGNEQYYEPVDQGLIIGRKAAQAIEDAKGIERLRRASMGVGQTTNLIGQSLENLGGEVECFIDECGGWEPTWTLRDDPDLDTATIERIMREGDSGE